MKRIVGTMKKAKKSIQLSFVFVAFYLLGISAYAEGTKQLSPSFGDNGNIILDNGYSAFATYSTTTDDLYRLNISICEVGEVIHFGFRVPEDDIYFRIKDPNGNIVYGPTLIPNAAAAGRIEDYAEAVAGPSVIDAAGYSSLSYTSTMTGDYYIEFNDGDANTKSSGTVSFSFFDITVLDPTSTDVKTGRLWSREWNITCNSYTNEFNGSMFIYSTDGIVTEIDFNGIMPYQFTIAANATGTQSTGNTSTDRQSQGGNVNFPDYRIFLNDPDSVCFPTGVYGQLTAPTTITGCDPDNRCINVSTDKEGTVDIVLDLDNTLGYQTGGMDRIITAEVNIGTNCVPWDGRDGEGNYVSGGITIPVEIQYQNGITHLPLYDVENHPVGYKVSLIRPQNGIQPNLFWDDDNVGGTNNLDGCVTLTGCHTWGDNTGSTSTIGESNTLNTWWIANIYTEVVSHDFENIFVDANGNNGSDTDNNDTTACSSNGTFDLSGSVSGSVTSGSWSSVNGGSFTNSTNLSTTYTFSAADVTNGEAVLVLASDPTGVCPAVTDTMRISFLTSPTSDAGPNVSICENTASLNLNGSVTNTTTGTWEGNGGTFSPNNTTLSTTYSPTAAELSSSQFDLQLISGESGVVTTGSFSVVTSDDAEQRPGRSPNLTSGDLDIAYRSSSDEPMYIGMRFENINLPQGATITESYIQFESDGTNSGTVNWSIWGEDIGNSPAFASVNNNISDRTPTTSTVSWSPPDWANNQNDTDTRTPSLNSIIEEIVGRNDWASNNDLSIFIYESTPSNSREAESADGNGTPPTLHITYTHTDVTCPSDTSTITITVNRVPTADAGNDITVCGNAENFSLSGTVTNTTSGTWSTSGTGTFDDATSLTPAYTPSAADITAGNITLSLLPTTALSCSGVADDLTVTFSAVPTADAGTDQDICENNADVTLNGSITIATSASWSGGLGTFSTSNTDLNATYTPTQAEINSGNLTLVLTTDPIGTCLATTDTVEINFIDAPTTEAGNTQIVCANNATVTLAGSVTLASGGQWTGNGTFTPDDQDLNATFSPTQTEIDAGISVIILETLPYLNCASAQDTVFIIYQDPPTANAGNDQDICENNPAITLSGTATDQTNVFWSGTNGGTYSPDSTISSTIYTPTSAEIGVGNLNIYFTAQRAGCLDVRDTVSITFTDAPTVTPGNDQTLCANNATVTLNGAVTVASGGTWTGSGGTFTTDSTLLTTTYEPSATEISNGSTKLYLTSTGNGTCTSVTDSLTVSFTDAPTITAMNDTSVCANNSSVTITGNVTIATGGSWSGGSGVYTSSNTNLTTVYSPSQTEIDAGVANLTLTSTGNGSCIAVTDQLSISITPAPTVTTGVSGDAISVCADSPTVSLAATHTVATGIIWSNGNGTYTGGNTTTNTDYVPTQTEINAGSVDLYITTTGNDNCAPVADTVSITITPSPTVDAGTDQQVCGDASSVNLNGLVTVATGSEWSTLGSGNFADVTDATTTYTPSANDITNDSVKLVLTTTGVGNCLTYTDTITLTFTDVPTVDAGNDSTICSNDWPISLNGNGSPAIWTTSGTGSFSPSTNVHNAVYTPSSADSTNGTVNVTLTTIASGACPVISEQITLTLPTGPVMEAGLDSTICASNATYTVVGSSSNKTDFVWTSTGSGAFDDANIIATTYTITATDITTGTVDLILTSTNNGFCSAATDTMTLVITPAVVVDAGSDVTRCVDVGNITLDGSVITATGAVWTTTGDGTFAPNDSTLTGTYSPGTTDSTNGIVTLILTSYGNGDCAEDIDSVDITLTPAPTVDAGTAITVCADSSSIQLNGAVTIATGGDWSTSGDGSFSTSFADLTTLYIPGDVDTSQSAITLYLTSTGNGDCSPVIDSTTINFTPIPSVNAGINDTICANAGTYSLSGSVINATGGVWASSGTGTFSPNDSTVAGNYTLSSADSTNGIVTLTLRSYDSGICEDQQDQIIITIDPIPVVNAGLDQTLCKNISAVTINGSVTIATGGKWTTSGDGTFANDSILSTTYIPSTNDTNNGTVTLYITSTGNNSCAPITDSLIVTFTDIPTANVSDNQTICADALFVTLIGAVTNATGETWTTSGDGNIFASITGDTINYQLGSNDISNGTVTIYYTSDGNGPCAAAVDSSVISIAPQPTIDAGTDHTVCADTAGIQLNGVVTIATGARWTTTGSGTFSPNDSTLSAIYQPSAIDTAAGSVTLTLTSTGNGLCNSVSDQLTISITPAPTVDAGGDQTICADLTAHSLNGSITTATGAYWQSLDANGVFITDSTQLNAQYFHNISTGTVQLILTTTGNGLCKAVTDTTTLVITETPTIDAGSNATSCNDGSTAVPLTATAVNAGSGLWTTSGNGTFFPSANSLTSSYEPDPTDSTVTLYVTTVDMGTCNAVTDSLVVNFDPQPIVNAGTDIEVCADVDFVNLNGSFENALLGIWKTSGSGTWAPDSTSNNSVYTPSQSDRDNGSVLLTYYTTGSGSCDSVFDNMTITITPEATAAAGPDITVCVNEDSLVLTGNTTFSDGGFWDTDGAGYFTPNNDSTTVTYVIDNADKTAGLIDFIFYANGTGSCLLKTDDLAVTFTSAPTVDAGGPTASACADTSGFELNASGSNGTWSGGGGTFEPSANNLLATYKPTLAETTAGTVTLTFTSDPSGACPVVTDDVTYTIIPLPAVNAGSDITICADTAGIEMNAIVNSATGVVWTTQGSGTFNDSSLTNAVYSISSQDIQDSIVTLVATTTGNGICDAGTDNLKLFINPTPIVSAGFDQSICSDADSISLSGSVKIAGGGEWSTTGSGSFSPDETTLAPQYMTDPTDGTNPDITFYLTSTNNGLCQPVIDTVVVSFSAAPTISAGPDDTLCQDNPIAQLDGSVTVATGVIWSTINGQGTFSPSQTDSQATYNADILDIINGSVDIVIESTGNGTCKPVSDTMTVNLQLSPIVFAGTDFTICANNSAPNISALIANTTEVGWTTTGSGTFADSSLTATTYQHSAQDIANGGVSLVATSIDNGKCSAVSDVVNITITPAPVATVNAGFDQIICADKKEVDLQGIISVATGAVWRTLGDGTFEDTVDLTTTYTLTSNDSTSAFVQLTLTTTGNGICGAETDTMSITITPAPTVNAGNDTSVCADISSLSLNGVVTVATGGTWTTTGDGTFAPNDATLIPEYTPGVSDLINGVVSLKLTSTGNGTCLPVDDDISITLTTPPTVDAGLAQEICADAGSVFLDGSITIATGGEWTTSGDGVFIDSSVLNTTYMPSQNDIDAGVINLFLTTTGNGKCNAVNDNFFLTITPAPTISAGFDMESCENNSDVTLNGNVTIATGGTWSGGNGTFSPDPHTIDAVYTPTPGEAAFGSVELVLTTTGNGKCNTYTDTMNIDIAPTPQPSADVLNVCTQIGTLTELDGSVQFATGGVWSTTGDGVFAPNTSTLDGTYKPSTNDINTGFTTLVLTTTGNGTCIAESDSITVLIKDLPIADAGIDRTICIGDNYTLVAGSYPDITYEWFDLTNTSLSQESVATVSTSVNTSFILTVTDLQDCEVNDTVDISVITPPTLNLNDFYCLTDTITMDAQPSIAIDSGTYQWTFGSSVIPNEDSTFLVSEKITSVGDYFLIYNFDACTRVDSTVVVQPISENEPEVLFCEKHNETAALDAGPGDNYLWEFSGANIQTEFADTAGTYYVLIYDALGCYTRDSIILTDVCEPEVYIPTAISPNGDGDGDKLDIFGIDYQNFTITVYNRWGQVIFYSENPDDAWDGTFENQDMPHGVYQYVVTYEGLTEEFKGPFQKEGRVTIIR